VEADVFSGWKKKVKKGSMIIVRPFGRDKYSVTVKELTNSGSRLAAVVEGHKQVNGNTVGEQHWVRAVRL
jgi:hypothetical protein